MAAELLEAVSLGPKSSGSGRASVRRGGGAPDRTGRRPHAGPSFRHFFVSEAIHAQIPLFEVAAWVGHRTTRTTELVYGHLVRRAMDRGARTMHNRLGLKLQPFKGLIVPPSLTPSEDDIEDWDDVA
ncbi:hypothetical protein ACWD4N_04375 [Streptomyces sp. NPDC002586]